MSRPLWASGWPWSWRFSAFLIFMPGVDEDDEGIATTAPPEGVTSTEAEGGMADGGSN